jgi:hypothetical protein
LWQDHEFHHHTIFPPEEGDAIIVNSQLLGDVLRRSFVLVDREFGILVLQCLDLVVILAHEKLEFLHALRSNISGYVLCAATRIDITCWYSAVVVLCLGIGRMRSLSELSWSRVRSESVASRSDITKKQ